MSNTQHWALTQRVKTVLLSQVGRYYELSKVPLHGIIDYRGLGGFSLGVARPKRCIWPKLVKANNIAITTHRDLICPEILLISCFKILSRLYHLPPVAAPEGRSRVGFSLCEAAERRRREERDAEGSRRRRR